jgi:hypothetical protein
VGDEWASRLGCLCPWLSRLRLEVWGHDESLWSALPGYDDGGSPRVW